MKFEVAELLNSYFLFISERNFAAHKIEIHDNMIATTKKEKGNHGFGILNIRGAVAKYDGECQLSVVKQKEDLYEFHFEIMIPIPS